MTIAVHAWKRYTAAEMEGWLVTDAGRRLSGTEVSCRLAEAEAQGFEVLPMCDNHDAKGHCLGHDRPHLSIYT